MSYYDQLGIHIYATDEQITKAYLHKMSLTDDEETQECLTIASSSLLNPQIRAIHDQLIHSQGIKIPQPSVIVNESRKELMSDLQWVSFFIGVGVFVFIILLVGT